jgi:hypothetical protein
MSGLKPLKPLTDISSTNSKKGYNYTKETTKQKKSFTIDPVLADKLERDSFHSRESESEIVDKALAAYYKDRDFEEIPEDFKKKKRK